MRLARAGARGNGVPIVKPRGINHAESFKRKKIFANADDDGVPCIRALIPALLCQCSYECRRFAPPSPGAVANSIVSAISKRRRNCPSPMANNGQRNFSNRKIRKKSDRNLRLIIARFLRAKKRISPKGGGSVCRTFGDMLRHAIQHTNRRTNRRITQRTTNRPPRAQARSAPPDPSTVHKTKKRRRPHQTPPQNLRKNRLFSRPI